MAERKTVRKITPLLILAVIIAGLVTGCVDTRKKEPGKTSGKNMMKHARMIRMWDDDGYSVTEVISPSDSSAVLARYILVDRDSILPENLPEGTLLRTPLERMTVFSTVYTDALDELGAKANISGVVDARYITTPSVLEGLENGAVADCGSSMSPSAERILASRSDGIVYCQYEGMDVKGIDRLGVPLITMTDNYETDPLGRAEWILFLGALSGHRAEAEAIFNGVESRYEAIRTRTARAGKKPKVMTDNLYQGVWYVPGGRSYQARMIADAGGDYIFSSDVSAGTLSKSLEEMIAGTHDADIWIMRTIRPVETLAELKAEDNRYSFFKPFRKAEVYAADGSRTDVFSVSAFHPDVMLREYALIFGTEEGESPRFYKKLRQ